MADETETAEAETTPAASDATEPEATANENETVEAETTPAASDATEPEVTAD